MTAFLTKHFICAAIQIQEKNQNKSLSLQFYSKNDRRACVCLRKNEDGKERERERQVVILKIFQRFFFASSFLFSFFSSLNSHKHKKNLFTAKDSSLAYTKIDRFSRRHFYTYFFFHTHTHTHTRSLSHTHTYYFSLSHTHTLSL